MDARRPEEPPFPSILDAVMGAELDRLPAGERTALELASVVGRSFTCASVAALASPHLRPQVGSVLGLALARRRVLRIAGRRGGRGRLRLPPPNPGRGHLSRRPEVATSHPARARRRAADQSGSGHLGRGRGDRPAPRAGLPVPRPARRRPTPAADGRGLASAPALWSRRVVVILREAQPGRRGAWITPPHRRGRHPWVPRSTHTTSSRRRPPAIPMVGTASWSDSVRSSGRPLERGA